MNKLEIKIYSRIKIWRGKKYNEKLFEEDNDICLSIANAIVSPATSLCRG